MGNINKYCPACGSQKVHKEQKKHEQHFDINIGVYYVEVEPYYECGDCDGTWEKHEHRVHREE